MATLFSQLGVELREKRRMRNRIPLFLYMSIAVMLADYFASRISGHCVINIQVFHSNQRYSIQILPPTYVITQGFSVIAS